MSGSSPAPAAPERTDLRLVPAALAAWAGMGVATAGLPWLLIAVAAAAVGVLWWGARRRSWPVIAVGVVLLICMATGAVRLGAREVSALARLGGEQAVVVLEARLVGGARESPARATRPAWWASRAVVTAIEGRGAGFVGGGPVLLSASGPGVAPWSALAPGTVVRVVARLAPAEPWDGVEALARAREPPAVLADPGALDAGVERVRGGLREAVAPLDPEPRALIPALVVGDTSRMPEDLVERFRVTGLTHLVAVSGSNLVLFLAFLRSAARWLGVRGWGLRGTLVVGTAAFVLLCRAEPSVVRAAAMGLVGLAALGQPGGGALRALCVAVLVVVSLDPDMARSVGFALSVIASGGLVLWAGRWAKALGRWLPPWLAEALAVPLAAQVATQPVVTALSGQISLVGILANLAAAPLVGPATVLGFLAAAASLPLPWVARVLGWLAGWCAQGLCWVARLGEVFPGSVLRWPASPVGLGLLTIGCLGLVWFLHRALVRPWVIGAMAVLLVVVLVRPPTVPGWPPPRWVVAVCDVGQGDATLLRAGEQDAVVVDTGPDPAELTRCLRELGVRRVPLIVLTHLHADHSGGLAAVTGEASVVPGDTRQHLLASAATTPEEGFRSLTRASVGAELVVGRAGLVLTAGWVTLTVLAARAPAGISGGDEGESAAENDASLVLRAEVGRVRVMLAGDVQEAGQQDALAGAPDLAADVLLVPHHGSGHQEPAFLTATRAGLALVSVGADNGYGHPAGRTLRVVQQAGMQLARTDQQGTIAVWRADDGQLMVTSQRSPP